MVSLWSNSLSQTWVCLVRLVEGSHSEAGLKDNDRFGGLKKDTVWYLPLIRFKS